MASYNHTYTPRYNSKVYLALEEILEKKRVRSGEMSALYLSRLYSGGLVKRKEVHPQIFEYKPSPKGRALFKQIRKQEQERQRQESIFTTF